MKKKILSIALVLCMVLTVMPMAVFADDKVLAGEGTADDTWITLTENVLNSTYKKSYSYYLPAGNYKLGENIVLDAGLPLKFKDYKETSVPHEQETFSGEATLDLNGYTLSGGAGYSRLIEIGKTGTLTIEDSSESKSGKVDYGYKDEEDSRSAIMVRE